MLPFLFVFCAFEAGFWIAAGAVHALAEPVASVQEQEREPFVLDAGGERSEESKAKFDAQKTTFPAMARLLQNHAFNVLVGLALDLGLPSSFKTSVWTHYFDGTDNGLRWNRVLGYTLCVDWFFYWGHRALHRFKRLYGHHQHHHRWVGQLQPEAALDSSVVEHCVNFFCTLLPLWLGFRINYLELVLFYFGIGFNVALTHSSGLHSWSHVQHHLDHHRVRTHNFGGSMVFDWLFGTSFHGISS